MKILLVLCILLLCGFSYTGPETELIEIINKERAANGTAPLTVDWKLARLARYKTEEMIKLGYVGHDSPAYGSPRDMLNRFGIEAATVGVNVAKGQENADCVADAWFSSPCHKRILLDKNFTHIGVGYDTNEFAYWTIILTP